MARPVLDGLRVTDLPEPRPRRRSRLAFPLRLLRRGWRRLRLAVHPPEALLVYHPDYAQEIPGVPMDPQRGERILAFLAGEGLFDGGALLRARRASLERLLRVHDESYLHTLQDPATLTRILGFAVDLAEAERVIAHQRLLTGGTLGAMRWAWRSGGIGVNLGGGLHHATASEGMGFCVFNDVAVAVRALREWGFEGRVLVVDLDLHDGNGTRAIFADDPSVHTYSLHGETWGPERALASSCIALGHDVGDAEYLEVLETTLPGVFRDFAPELVVYVAGADVAAGDRLGDFRLSPEAVLARDRRVVELARSGERRLPLVMTLAGGYGDEAWRYPARCLAWLASGERLEPPPTEELTLARYRRLSLSLNPAELTGSWDNLSFRLEEADILGLDPGLRQDGRFLGFFTRHGVELSLERLGLLRRLREKGFAPLRLELDATGATGQTLRILCDTPAAELLVELRAARSRRPLPGMEVIAVEWLLLQNPRRPFPPGRPALPGQEHPGLGMLRDFFSWLVVACEMLELDGVHFTPSHYHVAVQSRRLVRFVEPEHEARMRALQAALEGIPLNEATLLVDAGRVVDATSGEPMRWEAFAMVLPVSEPLKQRVYGADYERRVDEVLAGLSCRVRP